MTVSVASLTKNRDLGVIMAVNIIVTRVSIINKSVF